MASISPTNKKSESESDSSDINNASFPKNKEAETRGKDDETETRTDNTHQDTQVKDLQSAGAQFENSMGDQSGNTVVDREKDCNLVEKKGGVGSSDDSQQVKVDVDINNASFPKNKEAETRGKDDETETRTDNTHQDTQVKDLQSAGAQFENSIGDQSGNTVVDREKDCNLVEKKGDDGLSGDTENVQKEKDDLMPTQQTCSSEFQQNEQDQIETTKLIPSAPETETGKRVNEKSLSESGVGSSGDSRQVKVDDEKTKPISSGSHIKNQPYSKAKTLKTEDEGSDREPEFKEEELPQHPPYSGLPQQRPQQIREGTDTNLTSVIGILVVLLSVVCGYYLHCSGQTPNKIPKQLDMVEVFSQEMEKLQASFPSQRPELWKRSLIHIRRHLKTEHPTEPVSLILTSGRRAEKTLGCLAQCLAQAFSTTRNSTFLSIDGKAKTSLDSDQVKLDIDSELTKAFESEKFAAVIHRFEELPPGSTLIFYRYCDHENAAYKNVFLAFTVMLDAEAEVPSNINLGRIEEMVQDHVKQKFVSSDKSAVFNQMDVDKLSGLWGRISHLILPVVAEMRIEQQGCGACDKPF
ncbi:LOW QUALITY PROTEIN: torsin-1A-interacting protein 2 [Danio aesculapii]|uniref:LOW QUALITY PROTEIN: torsin-1A-interacting protein 2 n=1 Tax=Danio aesculapii TaxID=1142201 RepID=UPI0024C072D6|nr:LOW QUALITY PROTEIN: torsin-1A-interacting protein 2 [Danio aesculapii]